MAKLFFGLIEDMSILVWEWLGRSINCSSRKLFPASFAIKADLNPAGNPRISAVTSVNRRFPCFSVSAFAHTRS